MATTDKNTVKWKVEIDVSLTGMNRHGEETGGGDIHFTKTIESESLDILAMIENIK